MGKCWASSETNSFGFRCDSLAKLQGKLNFLHSLLLDSTHFKSIYRYAFDFSRVSYHACSNMTYLAVFSTHFVFFLKGQRPEKFRHRNCKSNAWTVAWKAVDFIKLLLSVLRSIPIPRLEQRPVVQRSWVFTSCRCRPQELRCWWSLWVDQKMIF